MNRPNRFQYFLAIAEKTSKLSTCSRRAVGCILVNKRNYIIATGYNGVPAGYPHCNEGHSCKAANAASGTNLSGCLAIHAEANALLQCSNVDEIFAAYVTHSPCIECAKLLANTSCEQVIFSYKYAHDAEAREIFLSKNLYDKITQRVWLEY